MTLTFPATPFTATSGGTCRHWVLTFDVTNDNGVTRTITQHMSRDDLTNPDFTPDTGREAFITLAIVFIRYFVKQITPLPTTRAGINAALANKVVVI